MPELFSFGDSGWGDELLYGLSVTIRLALAALPLGLMLGFLTAMATLSPSRGLRAAGTGYTLLMRGLPELLTLFLVYNGLGLLLNMVATWWTQAPARIDLSPFIAGIIALALVFGAFSGEVLRGAFQALDPGQIEAGRAIGMTPRKIFLRIKVPQVWRFALPGLGNLWISLLKDTALVSIIALDDLMRMTKIAVGVTKLPFTFYLIACLIYWGMCILSEIALGRLEARSNVGVRRV